MKHRGDGELPQLAFQLSKVSGTSLIRYAVLFVFLGALPLLFGFIWFLFHVTKSRHGRVGSARWLTRALLPVGTGLLLSAFALGMPFLFGLSLLVLLMLTPLSLWRFVSSMSRPGSALHRRISWHGPILLTMTVLNLLCLGGALLIHVMMPASLLLALPIVLFGLFLIVPPLLSLLLMTELWRFWPKNAAHPEEHASMVASQLRQLGMDVSQETFSVQAQAGELSVHFDAGCAPARAVIECPIPGLPLDLTIRARVDNDPPGLRLDDPLIDNLLFITADDPDAVARLLRDLHEDLLENLHAWPGSRVADGRLYIQMDGPPFTNPRSTVQDHTPSPENSAAAVLSQIHSATALVDRLQSNVATVSASQRHRQPLSGLER